MEKYGVDQREVDELVKLGSSREEALAIVASGDGPKMIKEANLRLEKRVKADVPTRHEQLEEQK